MYHFIILICTFALLSGCESNPTKPIAFTNSKYKNMSQEQGRAIFERDFSACQQLALKSIPIPRSTGSSIYTSPRQPESYSVYNSWGGKIGSIKPDGYSEPSAPSLASMYTAIEMERNNPMNIYQSSLRSYTTSCITSKGWHRSS